MDNKDMMKRFWAGIFFVVGIIFICGVIFTLGKDKGLTQSKFQIVVLFSDVDGLIEGAPVQVSGVNVGNVSDISFVKKSVQGRRVKVILNIFDKYQDQFQKGVDFTIKPSGILGEKLVEINVFEDGQPLDLSQPALGNHPIDVSDLAEAFSGAARSFTRASENFNEVEIQELAGVLADTAQSLSETSQGINTILSELQYITKKSKRLINRVEQRIIDGTLFKVF